MSQMFCIDGVPSDVYVDADSPLSYHTGLEERSGVVSGPDFAGNIMSAPITFIPTCLPLYASYVLGQDWACLASVPSERKPAFYISVNASDCSPL